jgi:hypothetical protein
MKLSGNGATSPMYYTPSKLANFARISAKTIIHAGAILTIAATALLPMPARAAEHELAGIRIFASVRDVLDRFGDPTQILTGAAAQSGPTFANMSGANTNGSPFGPGGAAASGQFGPTGAPGSVGPGGNPFGGGRPSFNPGVPMMGPNGPMGPFGPGGPMGQAGQMGPNGTAGTSTPTDEVLYVYQRSGGIILEFLLSPDGRVIQIEILGYKAATKTSKGVGLGTSYSTVIDKYGYPESQDSTGNALTVKYLDKQHVSFQLHQNKVVGITVAAVQ